MIVNNLVLRADNLTTVSTKDSLERAYNLIKEGKFLSIPVIDNTLFKGVISLRRIYAKMFEDGLTKEEVFKLKVKDVYDSNTQKIKQFDEIEKAVQYLEIKNISFLAVINEQDEFVGIITHKAIFSLVTSVYGINKGKRIAITVQDAAGQISKISKLVKECSGNIISIVIQDPKSAMNVREVVMRIDIDHVDNLLKKFKKAGYILN